ncbi:MAG TPA: NTP transferase domain-containing protein [Vicinamibacterales bacterium]|jgi:1L-myo-inositol 1-phosphate cytidylyltransferase
MSSLLQQAIILAAGNGDRFSTLSTASKLTALVGGTPLLVRTLTSAREAGILDAHVVVGYDSARVRALALSGRPDGMTLRFHVNRDWHKENGISVLTARERIAPGPFALLMGDHIFEPELLRRLIAAPRASGETLIGVDRSTAEPAIVEEATKVRVRDGRVTAIGKHVRPFDGLDTGLFVCDPSIFDALDESCAAGDTTLSGGIARLASRGLVRGVDVGDAHWWDIDTLDDLTKAEALVSVPVS